MDIAPVVYRNSDQVHMVIRVKCNDGNGFTTTDHVVRTGRSIRTDDRVLVDPIVGVLVCDLRSDRLPLTELVLVGSHGLTLTPRKTERSLSFEYRQVFSVTEFAESLQTVNWALTSVMNLSMSSVQCDAMTSSRSGSIQSK